jgi:3-dehydroquinate dehydratase-2
VAGPGNPQFAMKADHAVQIAVIQGPNLNRLGIRRPERYGTETLADVTSRLGRLAARLGVELQHMQSNHEGELIDWLHERMDVDAVIVNPAGLTPYGRPLLDSVSDVGKPVAVVHIAQLYRHYGTDTHDIFKAVADVYVCGLGTMGYSAALVRLVQIIRGAEIPLAEVFDGLMSGLPLLLGRYAAVDAEQRADDVARRVRRQEQDGLGYLRRRAEAPDRRL